MYIYSEEKKLTPQALAWEGGKVKITTINKKELNLQIFHGGLSVEKPFVGSMEFVKKIHLKSGEVYPGLRGYTEEGKKVLIPLTEETYKEAVEWFDSHTTEEALVCNWTSIIE